MENGFLLTLAVAILTSSALSALITGLFAMGKQKKQKEEGVYSGVRVLLYDRIKSRGKQYITQGSVEPDALEDLISMHRIYHDELGGNGFLDKIMKDVRALPPVVEKEMKV